MVIFFALLAHKGSASIKGKIKYHHCGATVIAKQNCIGMRFRINRPILGGILLIGSIEFKSFTISKVDQSRKPAANKLKIFMGVLKIIIIKLAATTVRGSLHQA